MVRDSEVTFDESEHAYHIGTRRLPSVTQVLKLAGIIDDRWYTGQGCERGKLAHKAIELMDRGELDFATLDHALEPYCDAWDQFLADIRGEVVAIEHRVASVTHGFAGTLDRWLLVNGRDFLVDIKTGSPEDWHQLQTAAYALCLQTYFTRMSVYLRDDGTYKAVTHTDSADSGVFLSALAVANWKLKHGGSYDA